MRQFLIGLAAAAAVFSATTGTVRAETGFDRWVADFWPAASAAGVSRATFDRAFRGVSPDPEVLEKARYQPEFVRPMWDYVERAVSDERIANGRRMLQQYRPVLDEIERRYGVDRHILVAIWGMESSYGEVLDNPKIVRNVVRSLATLAYADPRRARFGREQLIAALKILERGDIAPERMTGSWAGAMGHTQFIPTTYEAYAVDFDGDGRRDLWGSPVDALASAANYLAKSGWVTGRSWGYEVALADGFDFGLADREASMTLAEWQRHGVRRADGSAFPRPDDKAEMVLPAGAKGPGFLMLRNHYVIKRYNNATSYALAVGHLADRLRGAGPFVQAWPQDERPLNEAERRELQERLARAGLYQGAIDGKLGPVSKSAIRAYQQQAGVAADGHAGAVLLEWLRGN
ncbi:MAG TPA: lytic murein transglycosylase [Afifellaceae bacterium]|nr:lytic murein transglycosylase [Afifellaceae bacterium]